MQNIKSINSLLTNYRVNDTRTQISHSIIVVATTRHKCYNSKTLGLVKWEEPCIGFIQENLIETSVQNSLPYIPWTHGPCELFLPYPKQSCVYLKANMCLIHCMTSSFQNLLCSSLCHMTCDCVIWCDLSCDSVIFVT